MEHATNKIAWDIHFRVDADGIAGEIRNLKRHFLSGYSYVYRGTVQVQVFVIK